MRTVTQHRTSVAWHFQVALTARARESFARTLDCVFTDENVPRDTLPIAHDVSLVCAPSLDDFTLVAHFVEGDEQLPPTDPAWLHSWVERACVGAALPAPPNAVPVDTGV